jgi:hypothetical protein
MHYSRAAKALVNIIETCNQRIVASRKVTEPKIDHRKAGVGKRWPAKGPPDGRPVS